MNARLGPWPLPLRKKLSTTVYMTLTQFEQLKALKRKTRVSEADRIREGIDLVLALHSDAPGGVAP